MVHFSKLPFNKTISHIAKLFRTSFGIQTQFKKTNIIKTPAAASSLSTPITYLHTNTTHSSDNMNSKNILYGKLLFQLNLKSDSPTMKNIFLFVTVVRLNSKFRSSTWGGRIMFVRVRACMAIWKFSLACRGGSCI